MLAYPTEILRQIYAMPLFPQSFLPFNLLFTLNAVRLNIEFHKAQRGADKAYLHVSPTSYLSLFLESTERDTSPVYEWPRRRSITTNNPRLRYLRDLSSYPFVAPDPS
jgi:hypothetical protein